MSILKVWDDTTKQYIEIPAIKGKDGKTPVKGVDYFTESDIAEIVFAVNASRLPLMYTLYNYLQSDGSAYIDTGICPSDKTEIEATVNSSKSNFFAALYGDGKTNRYGIYFTTTKIDMAFGATGYVGNVITTLTPPDKVVFRNGTIATQNKTYTFTKQSAFTNTQTLPLFGSRSGSTVTATGGILYECIIKENGRTVRHFFPCKNPNGVAGLYDVVYGVFYANAGSGSFSVG